MKRKSYSTTRSNSSTSSSKSSKTCVGKKGYRVFKDSGTPVHRWAAEKKLGRELRPGEVVHHKNRDKQDNSPGNLYVFGSQQEHWEAHKKDAKKFGREYSLTGKNKKEG